MEQREPDDTTKPDEQPTREPGGYYYDDVTGYEVYDPAEDEEDEETDRTPGSAGVPRSRGCFG